jgi:hypothetical protein
MYRKSADEAEPRASDSRRRHHYEKGANGAIENLELQEGAGRYFQCCVNAGLAKDRLNFCKSTTSGRSEAQV